MSHERIKCKSFLARKAILKIGECHAISFFTIVCWHKMIENSFKRCFLIYLRPLNSVPKSKVGKSPAHANRLSEYICRHSVNS